MKVMKFGGTSVGQPQRMKEVARLVTSTEEPTIVVLSALAGTTNALVEIGNELALGYRGNAKKLITTLEEKYHSFIKLLIEKTAAIEKANNSQYGLSAGIWSDKTSKIFHVSSKLRAGVVWSNTYNKFDPSSPFGGYKESGFGREGGLHGLMNYLQF